MLSVYFCHWLKTAYVTEQINNRWKFNRLSSLINIQHINQQLTLPLWRYSLVTWLLEIRFWWLCLRIDIARILSHINHTQSYLWAAFIKIKLWWSKSRARYRGWVGLGSLFSHRKANPFNTLENKYWLNFLRLSPHEINRLFRVYFWNL